jgi:hypothetical protein
MTFAGAITPSTGTNTIGAAASAARRAAVVASLLPRRRRNDRGPRGALAEGLEAELAGRLVVAQ